MNRGLLFAALLLVISFFFPVWQKTSPSNKVQIATSPDGKYELMLNEKPFYIQGAGVGSAFGERGENYIQMAKKLGANAIRSWGTDQGTRAYLDEAHRQGLYVNAGVWMNYVDKRKTVSYIHDKVYLVRKEEETLKYVKEFKNHPAILMWNLGNEVIHFSVYEEEKIAFCKFLEKLIQKVHAIDPHHPVTYAAAGTDELPYLASYVPSLDIIGINDYGSPIRVEGRWKSLFKIPYLFTEYGALGPWDMPKDLNGRFMEPNDYTKASQYRNYWSLVKERRGNNVGGFAFHLGETTQDTLTCFNINYHEFKKQPFIALQQLYQNNKNINQAPRIKAFTGVPASIESGGTFQVRLEAEDPEKEPLTYEFLASTAIEGILAYKVNSEVPILIESEGADAAMQAPEKAGLYRIYGVVKDASGNAATLNHTLRVKE